MANNFPGPQDILFHAPAQIVDNPRLSFRVAPIGHYARVVQPVIQFPVNDIARFPMRQRFGTYFDSKAASVFLEEPNLVRTSTVIDVAVWPTLPPWVRPEPLAHILMNEPLQIVARMPQCANHNVCANSLVPGQIPLGISDLVVARGVTCSFVRLDAGAKNNAIGRRGGGTLESNHRQARNCNETNHFVNGTLAEFQSYRGS